MQVSDLCKGALAGAIAGTVASAIMNRLVAFYPMESAGRGHGAQSLQPGQPENGLGLAQIRRDGAWRHHREDATERLAECVTWEATGLHLTDRQKQSLGTVVHYLFGGGSAAAYGLLAEVLPLARCALGLPFGTAVWLGADEGTLPLIGLSTGPSQQTPAVHLASLGSHWVYGLTTELIRAVVCEPLCCVNDAPLRGQIPPQVSAAFQGPALNFAGEYSIELTRYLCQPVSLLYCSSNRE